MIYYYIFLDKEISELSDIADSVNVSTSDIRLEVGDAVMIDLYAFDSNDPDYDNLREVLNEMFPTKDVFPYSLRLFYIHHIVYAVGDHNSDTLSAFVYVSKNKPE